MRDQEFFPQVRECSGPGEEVSRPGREWSAGGREYGQANGDAAPARKRRRVPLAVAAAVVTGVVLTAGPAGLPQPENFTREYRAYMDQLMTACEAGDELGLHRLATSDMASEIWTECLGPYCDELREEGGSGFVCYDGEEMVQDPPDAPALCFWHWELTEEEMLEKNTAGRSTQVVYFSRGSRREQGVQGVCYFAGYDGYWLDGGGQRHELSPNANIFQGRFSQDKNMDITYLEGAYRQYNIFGYAAQDSFHLDKSLEGQFTTVPEEDWDATYLEDGTLTVYFEDGSGTGAEVRDGVLRIEGNPDVTLERNQNGSAGLTFYIPGHSAGTGITSGGPVERLEDFLYHNPYTIAH